ncbi:MAG: hypothetical protein GY724_06835 [Actinomycetia bacterium]|nr:hypothetical protein [Actinomycetes bacterium]MCP4224919.1 hypothetical protein [Actinomycetes bacterium]
MGILLALVVVSCGSDDTDTTAAPDADADTTADTDTDTTTTPDDTSSGGDSDSPIDLGEFGGLEPCTLITEAEIGDLVGTDVVADETFDTDCFYVPAAGADTGLVVHTGAVALPGDECVIEMLQTDPIFPGEEVVSAEGFGGQGSVISSVGTVKIEICTESGTYLNSSVLGNESNSRQELEAIAGSVLDLLIDRV